jgi:hypothetical protein
MQGPIQRGFATSDSFFVLLCCSNPFQFSTYSDAELMVVHEISYRFNAAGGRRPPLQALAPPLILLPHAPLRRAAECRLDAVVFFQVAMRSGYENIALESLCPIVIHFVFDVCVSCSCFMARLWRA